MQNAAQSDNRGLTHISRQSLGDQVSDVLRNKILLGEFLPGSKIPERETAEALGVSRTPLREALVILEGEGLVLTSPSRSPVVSDPDLESLSDLLLVQSALEALAGECACDQMTNEEFSHINVLNQNLINTLQTADDIDFFATDMAFHEAIVASTKNEALIKTHKQYNARLWRARFIASREMDKRINTLRDHAHIVDGLRARDRKKTSETLSLHLRNAIDNIAVIFSKKGPLS